VDVTRHWLAHHHQYWPRRCSDIEAVQAWVRT
jgi:hypothetical protein